MQTKLARTPPAKNPAPEKRLHIVSSSWVNCFLRERPVRAQQRPSILRPAGAASPSSLLPGQGADSAEITGLPADGPQSRALPIVSHAAVVVRLRLAAYFDCGVRSVKSCSRFGNCVHRDLCPARKGCIRRLDWRT
jgi:hypothetical protein